MQTTKSTSRSSVRRSNQWSCLLMHISIESMKKQVQEASKSAIILIIHTHLWEIEVDHQNHHLECHRWEKNMIMTHHRRLNQFASSSEWILITHRVAMSTQDTKHQKRMTTNTWQGKLSHLWKNKTLQIRITMSLLTRMPDQRPSTNVCTSSLLSHQNVEETKDRLASGQHIMRVSPIHTEIHLLMMRMIGLNTTREARRCLTLRRQLPLKPAKLIDVEILNGKSAWLLNMIPMMTHILVFGKRMGKRSNCQEIKLDSSIVIVKTVRLHFTPHNQRVVAIEKLSQPRRKWFHQLVRDTSKMCLELRRKRSQVSPVALTGTLQSPNTLIIRDHTLQKCTNLLWKSQPNSWLIMMTFPSAKKTVCWWNLHACSWTISTLSVKLNSWKSLLPNVKTSPIRRRLNVSILAGKEC